MLQQKVRTTLKTCHDCETSKYPNMYNCVEIGRSITKCSSEISYINFLGPLPGARRMLHNLLSCTDVFTKAVKLCGITRSTLMLALNVTLNQYIWKHGPLKIKIIIVKGKQFQN